MTERSVHCTFHNVSNDLVKIISSSLNIHTLVKQKDNNQYSYTCSLSNARQIRSNLADKLDQYPQIWFSIDHDDDSTISSSYFLNNSIIPNYIYFGSLLSTDKFLIHSTPLDHKKHWIIKIDNKQTLIIETQEESIRLSLPLKFLHKQILVIDGEDFSEIIFNYNMISIEKMYGNNPIVQSLNQCTDFLICLSPKSNVDRFLNYFQINYNYTIYYTIITIQRNHDQWSNNYLNSYRTENTRYSISMLHSLGYVFDDKYLNNTILRNQMIELAEENEWNFYNLSLEAYEQLEKCHWFDLTKIFNKNSRKRISKENNIQYISVIYLTPTRLLIKPKEKTKGHRILHYSLFKNINHFCLVYIKPDPPNLYLNSNNQMLEYFQDRFQNGIELNGYTYHLFGASNSQIKDHSFWFLKASSLDEIHQKRQLLGEFHTIRNLGTYVARLGLCFSKTDPTYIEFKYCLNENEFNYRVKQGELCIMMIDDIERNSHCFTDGNGLVSKGLAKLINEKVNKSSIIPSAYQIRIAGCKGLIIIDPQSTYEQYYIKIRPSMKKFESNHWILDICGFSRATPTRLNNQFIWLLSDLGVPDITFFRLQQRWFSKKPSRSKYSDDLLKNKIPLPVNECRYLYGCALESNLEQGQCFIRYEILNDNGQSFSQPKYECVRGRVIVTKNPCPYAGDMLELWAVDLPELSHLHDVIVFSVRGERPDFNKIAGSDLDGDGYFIYWGEELRLKYQVQPLDYTPDEKQYQSTDISPIDIIKYYLSILNATSSGEIYNLHAVIVDKNSENYSQRTCQPLAIELARMFSSSIDSGKTGYIIDKKRIKEIREKIGGKYPDFLGKEKSRSYQSKSIVGKLYHNALNYKYGNIDKLEDIFAQMNINPSKHTTDQLLIPTNRSIQLHPGSPLSPIQNSVLINNDSSITFYNKIPPQFFLIDGMISSSSSIQLCSSTKSFYSEHYDLTRLRIELELLSSNQFKSCSSLLYEQISSCQYSMNDNELLKMIISFGNIYLLKYKDQVISNSSYPKTLDSLINNHFLPPLFDTFFPSTILERIEITKENSHCLQQIFYKYNHQIKRKYVQLESDSIYLIFPWFKMTFIDHQREILLICLNTYSKHEICIHFDKNGRIKSLNNLPKIFFKCFHQQNSSYHCDILYEFRSYSIINQQNYSSIFKHETLLDPTHPLTLPLQDYIIPIISYSIIRNIFYYDNIEVHIIRTYVPIHYKNDDFYKLRCTLGYIEQLEQQISVELHVHIKKIEDLNQEKLHDIIEIAKKLSQMLD
ncbi:unnamed protein product [Adineta steineri]|uniref:RNA-dependent RNA polymerase n=1 Tax=Adineta steineri TaxID=433720 RepID=A0A815SW41_9BILA|nr:unnamed protein product [Adineta steineri]CAF1642612.1 unnamed protein product [Adineta steineri]